jgi:hypothetical protein
MLLQKGVVLCKSLENGAVLNELGIHPKKQRDILEEIHELNKYEV